MLKAVLFDMDGTVTDTEKLYSKFWTEAAWEAGYDFFTREDALFLRSLNFPDAKAEMEKRYGESFDLLKVKLICREKMKAHEKAHGIELKSGAKEILLYLKEKNIRSAICTATDAAVAKERIETAGLTGLFDTLLSAHMVKKGKPHPDLYLFALKELSLKTDECIAVEDSPNGVMSAAGAGIRTVMVHDLTAPDDNLRKYLYSYIPDLFSLKEIIEKM